jgi:flavin-dependent dehydrogenase
MTRPASNCEALVIGGGASGAAAACHLAQAGRSVILIEKEAEARHKVCGEFLSAEALSELRHLGVDVAGLGAAPIGLVRLIHGVRTAETALPFQAAGLSRLVLDEHLLRKAEACGARVVRGSAVRDLIAEPAGRWRAETQEGAAFSAEAVFLASGKHELRRFKRERATPDRDIGFKLHWRLAPVQIEALRAAVEVILFAGGYAGLQRIEGDTANLCLLVRKSNFMRLNKSWQTLLSHLMDTAPHLRMRLAGAAPCWDEPLAISALPFGYLCNGRSTEPGLYRLGDQFAVIPAFSGSGLSIALRTARLAALLFLQAGANGAAMYHWQARHQIGASLRLASGLSRISASPWAQALAVQTCRAFPSMAAFAAARTRIPATVAAP